MGVVPLVTQQQVAPAGLPNAVIGVRATPQDFGAGIGEGLGNLAAVQGEKERQARARADNAMVNDAAARLRQLSTSKLYDPKTGLLNMSGPALFEANATASEDWDQTIDEVRKGLANDEQRAAFDAEANGITQDFFAARQQHVGRESIKFRETSLANTVASARDSSTLAAGKGLIGLKAPQFVKDSAGNMIDLSRPELPNPDGSYSTEVTIGIEQDGIFYNIPTIVKGKRLSDDQAVQAFQQGRNPPVGAFATQEAADDAAEQRTKDIAAARDGKAPPVLDDRVVQRTLEDTRRALLQYAKDNPELLDSDPATWVRVNYQAAASELHKQVLTQLLATPGQDAVAAAYLGKHQFEMDADTRAAATRSVAGASLAGQSSRTSADIFERTFNESAASLASQRDGTTGAPRTLTSMRKDAMALVDDLPDGPMKDEVEQRVTQKYDRAERAAAADNEENYKALDGIVAQRGFDAVAGDRRILGMSADQVTSLRKRAKALATGQDIITDEASFYSLRRMASEDPEKFADEDLLLRRNNGEFDEGDYRQLVELQAGALASLGRSASASAKADAKGFDIARSKQRVIDDWVDTIYGNAGLSAGEFKVRAAEFGRAMDQAADALQSTEGAKALTASDYEALGQQLSAKMTVIDGGRAWFDTEKPVADLAKDIPADWLIRIRSYLVRKNLKVTDEAIKSVWAVVQDDERKKAAASGAR